MTKVPVTCSPQRWRNIIAERFMAGNGPKPSKATTGTTRNVTSDQMSAPTSAAKWPARPPRLRSALSTTLTPTDTSAQAAIFPARSRATPLAAARSGCSPRMA